MGAAQWRAHVACGIVGDDFVGAEHVKPRLIWGPLKQQHAPGVRRRSAREPLYGRTHYLG